MENVDEVVTFFQRKMCSNKAKAERNVRKNLKLNKQRTTAATRTREITTTKNLPNVQLKNFTVITFYYGT